MKQHTTKSGYGLGYSGDIYIYIYMSLSLEGQVAHLNHSRGWLLLMRQTVYLKSPTSHKKTQVNDRVNPLIIK